MFFISPEGNASNIRVRLNGIKDLRIDPVGELIVVTELGSLSFSTPVAYQDINGVRKPVDVTYHVEGHQYGFRVGKYDKNRTLIIDPLIASTYLGSNDKDFGYAMVISGKDVVIAGETQSIDFPSFSGSVNALGDVLVARLNEDLTGLIAVTVFGGKTGTDVAVDMVMSGSRIYLAGQANSSDFPLVGSGYSANGPTFIAKMGADLSLQVTTRFPANNVYGLALDASNNVFIAGATISSLPATYAGTSSDTSDDGYQITMKDGDGFISKLSANLDQLWVTTYLGGNQQHYAADTIHSIAIDTSSDVYVAGTTTADDFPTTPGAYDNSYAHTAGDLIYRSDIFVARLSNNLHDLKASTYLGGVNADSIKGGFYGGHTLIVKDGGVFVSGETASSDFPVDTVMGPVSGTDAFIAKFDTNLSSLARSIRIGGEGRDFITALSLSGNDLYAAGRTDSDDFPTTPAAYKTSPASGYDGGFISKFDSSLQSLTASTLIGGLREVITGIGIDETYSVVIAGHLYLDGFPTKANTYQANLAGDYDLFAAKLSGNLGEDLSNEIAKLSALPSNIDFGDVIISRVATGIITLTNSDTIGVNISNIGFTLDSSPDYTQSNDCGNSVPALSDCNITITFKPTQEVTSIATLRIASNDPVDPIIDIKLTGKGISVPEIKADVTSIDFGDVEIWSNFSDKDIIIQNTGVNQLNVSQISVSGANANEFSVYDSYNKCSGTPIAPSAQCTFRVDFRPKSDGAKTADLEIFSNDPFTPNLIIPMSGNGISIPGIGVRDVHYFDDVDIGKSKRIDIEVSSVGTADLKIGTVSISGSTDFKMDDNCSNESVPKDEHDPSFPSSIPSYCSIGITFNPTSKVEKTATLIIPSNDPSTPVVEVKLIGNRPISFEKEKSKTGCFIDTAAYGSYLLENVVSLCEFRIEY